MSKPLDPNSKSEFIRKNMDLPTGEIIELAKKAGIELKPNLIYMVRSKTKNGNAKPKRNGLKKVRASAMKKKNGHAAKAPKTKRKYTRRAPVVIGKKIPVSVSAIVQQFVKDLEEANKITVRAALEGLL